MKKTKHSEMRYTVTKVADAIGMYLAEPIEKITTEDSVDSTTGEIVTWEHHTEMMRAGTLIEGKDAMTLDFLFQSGEVKYAKVCDCRRVARNVDLGYPSPWEVTAQVGDKRRRFILLARGVREAMEIAVDFIEQSVGVDFQLLSVKGFHDCTPLTDNFTRNGIEGDTEIPTAQGVDNLAAVCSKFYLVELRVSDNADNEPTDRKFLAFAPDADEAKEMAMDWIINRRREQLAGTNPAAALRLEIEAVILSAAPVNCYGVIPPEFSKEYFDHDPNGSTCN